VATERPKDQRLACQPKGLLPSIELISGSAMAENAFAAVTAAFLASLVEVTEAYTIVLAVGLSKGWRSAIAGTLAALIALSFIVLLLGPLLDRIPLAYIQFPIGLLILLLGLGWLRKAILRSAGLIPLHDEDAILSATLNELPPDTDCSQFIQKCKETPMTQSKDSIFVLGATGTTGGAVAITG
jgi:hypothetical protein